MFRQKFYVVAHNPNTVKEAEDFLRAGANALAPDIRYANGDYYVSHGGPGSNPLTEEYKLIHYLSGLKDLLCNTSEPFNLAMILFDIKDPVFNVNEFLNVTHQYFFSNPVCSGVAVMITVAHLKDAEFLTNYNQSRTNTGIGVDQCSDPHQVLEIFQKFNQRQIAYANGITGMLHKSSLFYSITEAKFLQMKAKSFKMIFAWVLARKLSMKSYLQLGIDGIFADLKDIPELLNILTRDLSFRYELARNGHNPWSAISPVRYGLTVKTSKRIFAGSNALIRFTLAGDNGQLQTFIDSGFAKMMNRGQTNHIVLEGDHIGNLQSLSIELMNSPIGAGWLPEWVIVESDFSDRITCSYETNEWLQGNNPSITKNIKRKPG